MSERDPYRNPVWLLLPPTRTYPQQLAHRVDPLWAEATMCSRRSAPGQVISDPDGFTQCHRCNDRVWSRREASRQEFARQQRMQGRPFTREHSVRTVSGGLPGLGKR